MLHICLCGFNSTKWCWERLLQPYLFCFLFISYCKKIFQVRHPGPRGSHLIQVLLGPTKKCRRPPRTADDRLTAEAWFGPENFRFCVYLWSDFFPSNYFFINPHCHHDLITYLNHERLLLAMTAQYPHYRHPRRRTADADRIGDDRCAVLLIAGVRISALRWDRRLFNCWSDSYEIWHTHRQ